MTAGVDGSVEPEDAARDSRRDRRPGVFGDGVPVPSLVDQGVRGEDNVGRRDFPTGAGPAGAEYERDTKRRLHTLGHFSEKMRRGRRWNCAVFAVLYFTYLLGGT